MQVVLAATQIAASLAGTQGPMRDAMIYATAGGKGLRAFLVLESARLHGMRQNAASCCCCNRSLARLFTGA